MEGVMLWHPFPISGRLPTCDGSISNVAAIVRLLRRLFEHRSGSGWIGRQFSRECIRRVRSSSEEVALFGRPSIRLRDASAFVKSDEKRRQGRPGAQIRSQSARSLNTGAAYLEHSRYGGVFKRGAGLLESERHRVAGHNLVKVVVARIPCPIGIV